MYISRVQVEEGFLDGLDITLTQGLNVIIGARGTGKTSLIELTRFCLGVPGYTPELTKKCRDHALSVLGSGQVTLTLSDGARVVTVSRTAHDTDPQASGPFPSPIIFSQTEIENVGLHSAGRLRLLDSFVADRRRNDDVETSAISIVQSLSSEVSALRSDIEDLERQLADAPAIEQQIVALAPKEQELTTISAAAAQKKKVLDVLSSRIATNSVAASQAERLANSIARWKTVLISANSAAPVVEAAAQTDASPLSKISDAIKHVTGLIGQSLRELENAHAEVGEIVAAATQAKLADESTARNLRKDIENLQVGAGSVVSTGQQLRERKAQFDALAVLKLERERTLADLLARRVEAQDRLDEARQRRFISRQTASKKLLSVLGPRIKIGVSRAGQFDVYASTIADILRGSGLRYNDLSNQIAASVSPRELIDAAEQNDGSALAAAASINLDRATRVLAHIRSSNLGALSTVLVDDDVALQLLDGKTYKDIGDLSTGQRCTVVLPIVLQHADRMLVIDQPEDHIDNAFIVDTLIKAILGRAPQGQLLVSTHNANIPVLGDARTVIQLESDGRRGFVRCSGALGDPSIVDAISSVMEGGLEAFRRRAKFYEDNSLV